MGSSSGSEISRKLAYGALAALFAMNLLNYIDRYILAAVIGPVQKELVLDDTQGGFLSTAFFVSYSLFSPFMGWMGDRYKRKFLLAAGVGVWSLATFGSGFADSYFHMLLARSVMGIGEATYATLAPSLLADLFPREKRNRILSIFYVAVPVGSALGFAIGDLMHNAYGWRWAFFVVGSPGVLVALAALAIPEPRRGTSDLAPGEESSASEALPLNWSTYAEFFRNRSYVFNNLGMAMMTFAVGGLAFWAAKFLEQERRIDNAPTLTGAMVVLGGLLGTILGSLLGDFYSNRVRGAYFWISGLGMLASLPFILCTLLAQIPWLIFGSMAVGLTLIFMNTGPSNTIIVNVIRPDMRAAACAVNIFFIHFLGDIPSPPLMGLVSDLTHDPLMGLLLTLPALVLSGAFYCLGARYLELDQENVARHLKEQRAI